MLTIYFQIPNDVEFILRELNLKRYESYIVGGCVRDLLLSKTPKDWDITTSATPDEIKEVFSNYKVIDTGLKHGTVSVLINDIIYEVTTFRIDGEYSDNRTPDYVEFTTSLEEDLKRRDFTINAMAYSHKTGLIDLFGGQEDLENNVIKCVGNPNKRFQEDALRILRALRFSSVLGFDIEVETKKAIFFNRELLLNISAERISSELNKILLGQNVLYVLQFYYHVLQIIIPELEDTYGFNQRNPYHIYDIYTHIIHSVNKSENDLIVRLTMLLHDIGKPKCYTTTLEEGVIRGHFYGHSVISAKIAEDILHRLRYDNETIKKVVQLIEFHDYEFGRTKASMRKLLNKIDVNTVRQLFHVREADISAQNPKFYHDRIRNVIKADETLDQILLDQDCFMLKDLAIKGSDLVNLGFIGPIIGIILKEILTKVIDEELVNDHDLLVEYVNTNWQKMITGDNDE